jgi:glycosyltransferase involved in cell wall biosynthesis
VKRPWVAWEVARALPEVDFLFLGKNHFTGPGTWRPPAELANVRMVDHLNGAEKWQCFERAWFLLNPSIHEGLPVTFQEALAWETVIISSVNPERVPERFGAWVGEQEGDGLSLAPKFGEAICKLIRSPEDRLRLAKAGREWVESVHGTERFLNAFRDAAHALAQ